MDDSLLHVENLYIFSLTSSDSLGVFRSTQGKTWIDRCVGEDEECE